MTLPVRDALLSLVTLAREVCSANEVSPLDKRNLMFAATVLLAIARTSEQSEAREITAKLFDASKMPDKAVLRHQRLNRLPSLNAEDGFIEKYQLAICIDLIEHLSIMVLSSAPYPKDIQRYAAEKGATLREAFQLPPRKPYVADEMSRDLRTLRSIQELPGHDFGVS